MNTNDIENTIINILKNNHVRSFPANNGLMRYSVAPKSSFYNGLKHYAFELINDNSNSQYITQIMFTIESGTIHILMKE